MIGDALHDGDDDRGHVHGCDDDHAHDDGHCVCMAPCCISCQPVFLRYVRINIRTRLPE